jgi:uncharacterized protein
VHCCEQQGFIVNFEWDNQKNEENIRKHGIDFTDVPEIFNGPMLIDLDDRVAYGEDGWIGIGLLRTLVAVVIFTERVDDTIRIISARKATKYERKRYEQTFGN